MTQTRSGQTLPRIHTPPTHLAAVLKENRRNSGLTQKEMGELVGVSQKAVREIEQGREDFVNFGTLKTIFAYFGMTLVAAPDLSILEPTKTVLPKEELLKRLESIKKTIRVPYAIESIKLFGSYARGEARPDSDVDVLVSSKAILAAKDVFKIERIFELGLGVKKVDLVFESEMKNEIRETAEEDFIDV